MPFDILLETTVALFKSKVKLDKVTPIRDAQMRIEMLLAVLDGGSCNTVQGPSPTIETALAAVC
jgi:hypothetical protein